MRLECTITHRCNAVCDHCNKAVGLARFPSVEMTGEHMRRAVDQLNDQRIPVSRLTITGGEPIMNRHLQDILDETTRLRRFRGGRLLTNDLPAAEHIRDRIQLPPKWKWVRHGLDDPTDPTSGKNDKTKRKWVHLPFWISPADLGLKAEWRNCTVKGYCGKGLDSSGWSMCGKAAMFGRLLHIDPCMQDGDIRTHVRTPIEDICKHCQYGLTRRTQKQIFRAFKKGEIPFSISPTFERAFEQWKFKQIDFPSLVPSKEQELPVLQ